MIAIFSIEFVLSPLDDFKSAAGDSVDCCSSKEVEDEVTFAGGSNKSSGGGLATLTSSQSLLLSSFFPSVNAGLGRFVCFLYAFAFLWMEAGCLIVDVVLIYGNIGKQLVHLIGT